MTIGELIARERAKLGLSQYRLGKIIGVGQSFITDIENGKRSFPEKRTADLPEPLRQKVAALFMAEHEAAIERLRDG